MSSQPGCFSCKKTRISRRVSPFPGPGGRLQVSRVGGGLPVWGADGRTLYYPEGSRMMAATLAFTPTITVTGTRTVLEGDYALDDPLLAAFDAADGTFRPGREARTVAIRDFATEIRNQLAKQGVK